MKFYDDDPVECTQCNKLVYAGDTYLKHHAGDFCSEECLGEFLIEQEMKNIEFVDLLTAEDHEDNWGDIKCHEMIDERAIGE